MMPPPPSAVPDPPDEMDEVDRELATWDEELRQGMASPASGMPLGEDDTLAPLLECVQMLHRAWPVPESQEESLKLPRHLGRFQIARVLGCGGFGIVYLATDPRLGRLVALKVPRLLSLADEHLRERFRQEARAAAGLDHPHIIPIYETGVAEGVDYIAAGYCAGPDLAAWLRDQTVAVAPRQAAALIACLADALDYSHQRGVLHRDLKPANVLLAQQSCASPATAGEQLPFTPRLTDFGLARLLDQSTTRTAASAMLGTPNYMAPEQTGPGWGEVGPATDVHGLGTMLYELLTGRPPFQSQSFAEVLDQVRACEPPSLARVRRDVPRDLEVICLKCLQKRPSERYATPQDLGADLRRFLRGEPVRARPPGTLAVAWKWCRRKPLAATLAALGVVLPLVGTTALVLHNQRLETVATSLSQSLWESQQWQRRSDRDRRRADERSEKLAQLAYASAVRLADDAFQLRDLRQCRAHLATAEQQSHNGIPLGVEWAFLEARTRASHRDLGAPLSEFTAITFAPGGKLLAAGGEGGAVQLIEMPSGGVRMQLATPHDAVRTVAFDPTGELLAVSGDDGTITLWNVADGRQVKTSPGVFPRVLGLGWIDEGRKLALATESTIRVWTVGLGDETTEIESGSSRLTCFAASEDGQYVAWGGHDGLVRLWKPGRTGAQVPVQSPGHAKVTALEFNNAGDTLVVGDNHEHVNVFRIHESRVEKVCFLKCHDDIRSLAFSPGDDQLAILQKLGTVEIYELPPASASPMSPGKFRHGWLAHEERGSQIAWSPGGSELVTVGRGSDRPRAWNQQEPLALRRCTAGPGVDGRFCGVAFTNDSRDLVIAGRGFERWSLLTSRLQAPLGPAGGWYENLAISADGRWLAADQEQSTAVELWDLSRLAERPEWILPGQRADALRFSPREDWLAVADWGGDRVVIVDCRDGSVRATLPSRQCHAIAIARSGEMLVANDLDDLVVWTTNDWVARQRLKGHVSTIRDLDISADGAWLASAGDDREIRLWRTSDWTDARILGRLARELTQVKFLPDGTGVVALDDQGDITISHVATGLQTCRIWNHAEGSAHRFALSADGSWLGVRLNDGQVLVRQLGDRP